jgi:GNAT superfamily N-acetyltransferase
MIIIREANKDDAPQMMHLIKELAIYERAPQEVINTSDQLATDGWGTGTPLFTAFVAEEQTRIIGMALFHNAYSTWKGRYIYLDDLIVEEAYRRKGVGKMLFDRLIKYCKEVKAQQLRWHVLDWNETALNFYRKYNASLDPEWITGKLHPHQFSIIDLNTK